MRGLGGGRDSVKKGDGSSVIGVGRNSHGGRIGVKEWW